MNILKTNTGASVLLPRTVVHFADAQNLLFFSPLSVWGNLAPISQTSVLLGTFQISNEKTLLIAVFLMMAVIL